MLTATPPLTERRVRVLLPRPLAWQRQVKTEAARYNVVCVGRRAGKTVLGQDVACERAIPGGPVGWFSPTYKMLEEVWRTLTETLHPVTARRSEQSHRLDLYGGGIIECWSLDSPDAPRGRKYGRVIVDEAAMVRALLRVWTAVIYPTLLDLEGDAWFMSTPRGFNDFHTLYQYGQAGGEWRSWQMPSHVNPTLPRAGLELAERQMPYRTYAEEVLAEFREDAGVFRGVRGAATATAQEGPIDGHAYVMGVDWALSDDFTVAVVLDATTMAMAAMDRYNQVDYGMQLDRVEALARRFNVDAVAPELNSRERLAQELEERGLPVTPFTTTAASKGRAIQDLARAFETKGLAILNDPTLTGELLAYQAERLPSGLVRYGAPEGMHDDCVMALAIALQAVIAGRAEPWCVYDD